MLQLKIGFKTFTNMVKYFIIFCLSVIISNFASSQTKLDSLVITRTIKNIVFISNETLYKITKIIQHDGVFVFTDYPIDSIYMRNNQVSKSYFPNKIRYTKLSYNYLPGVDTIFNFFSDDSEGDLYEKPKNINKELKFSYILTHLGESKLNNSGDSVFRIIQPCDELNISNTYEIVRLNLNVHKILLYTATGTSTDLDGIKLVYKDSVLLKLKDVKKIYKLIAEFKDLPNDECFNNEVGNSWLVECKIGSNYSRAIIAYSCMRKRTQKNLNIKILKKLNTLKVRYIPYDCKEPTKIFDFFYY